MAYGYWKSGIHEDEAAFNLLFRNKVFGRPYAICAGLASVIEYLQLFKFQKDDLAYLKTLENSGGKPLFEPTFLKYLSQLRFECDVEAIPEGTVVFPHEPLLRITGPLLQCQLLETPLLNIINFQTLIATKAAHLYEAAAGDSILEFGLRRAQGIDGGLSASRAAYIGGCEATSNTLAGKLYGIPVRGTHAHSWIMAFPTELESFEAYAAALPDNCIFLVDTYNTLRGVKRAIRVGKELLKRGKQFLGIRLDSGNLAELSCKARVLLDQAGFPEVVILASGDLDETIIQELKRKKAPITLWGVGTKLVTGFEQPALDSVYKLGAIRKSNGSWEYKLKLSDTVRKISAPGLLKVKRYYSNDLPVADVIYDQQLGIPAEFNVTDLQVATVKRKISKGLTPFELLKPVFNAGKVRYSVPPLAESRLNTLNELSLFGKALRTTKNSMPYVVGMEPSLLELKLDLISKAKRGKL